MPQSHPLLIESEAARREQAQLYREHSHWLVRVLGRRFNVQDAEDLCQEAYLRAARSRTHWSANPRAWLLRIALNAGLEQRRRASVRSPDAILGVGEPDEPSFASAPDQDQALLLRQVITSLPPKFRDVFMLSRFEGLTNDEIAQRCGISVKTVEWRMTRALAICAARLRD